MIRWLYHLFVHDWPLKLFSLSLAVLTWLAVTFSIQQRGVPVQDPANFREKTFFDLPVTLLSQGVDVSGYKVEPAEVDVIVQGTDNALQRLPRNGVRVVVDLSGVVLKTPQQLPAEVLAPAGIAHVRIKPDNLVLVSPPSPPQSEPRTNQP